MSAEAAIASLRETNPDAVRLAESVSFAMMIDRAFLRAMRLALTPPVDAGAEADLWFSSLVQSRTADGIVLHPEAADALRRRLAAERVEEVWALTSREHAWLAPSLQLEERIAYLSVSRRPTADDDLADCLRSVLAALVSGGRTGLAQWAVRALAMFPSRVQKLPEMRMLDAGTRMRLGEPLEPTGSDEPLPWWTPWVAPSSLESVPLDFELRDDALEIRTSADDTPVRVPKTHPLLLEVSWDDEEGRHHARQVTFRAGETATVPVSGRELVLRTIAGETFDLREQGHAPAHLREAIIDFSSEMQRHAVVHDREQEIDEVLRRCLEVPTISITGEPGAGKTAFLCELIREAARRGLDVFGHFFRFGDLRLESIASAERSIAAQIAVRFDLKFRDEERPLPDVLEQLARRGHKQPILIVLDDVDEARDARRMPDAELLLSGRSESFVHTIFTAIFGGPFAAAVHQLRPLARRYNAAFEAGLALATASYDVRQMRESIGAIAAAMRPLPLAVFEGMTQMPDPGLLRFEGDTVEVSSSSVRRGYLEHFGVEQCHRDLVRLLERARSDERVESYFLLNAPIHLITAGELDSAERLFTNLDFMVRKITMHGVAALGADFHFLQRQRGSTDLSVAMKALERHAARIDEAPRDLAAMFHTAFLLEKVDPGDAYGIAELPMRPAPVGELRTRETLEPRKHGGPVRGSTDRISAVITWSDDGTARLWFGDPPNRLYELFDHGAPVTAAHLRGLTLVSGDANGALHVWDVDSSRRISRIAAHDRAIDGIEGERDRIVTWAGNDPIRIWRFNFETIEPLSELAGASGVVGCSFVEDGESLLSASRDGTCRLWRLSDGALLETQTLSAPATGMTEHWNAEPRIVLTASHMLDVVLPTASGLSITSFDTGHELPPSGAAISEDGMDTATWSEDQTIRVWRFGMTAPPRLILREHRAAVTACRFGRPPAHQWLVSGDASGVAIVWDRESGKVVSRFHGHLRAIRTIAFRERTIHTAGDDGVVLQWDGATGALIADHSQRPGRIAACVVLPGDEPAALVSDGESTIRVDRKVLLMDSPLLAWSETYAFACAAGASEALTIDLQNRRTTSAFVPTTIGSISACAVSDTGLPAFGTNGGEILVLPFEGPTLLEYRGVPIAALAFANHPFLVSVSADGMLAIWNTDTSDLLHRIETHRSRVLALAAKGSVAATGSAAGTVRTWDVRSGRPLANMPHAHAGPVTALRIDGNVVVSASLDRTIRVFDVRLGTALAVCRGHTDTITGVVIAGHEEAIYSCSDDRTIRRWDLASGAQQAVAYGNAPFRCIDWRDGTLLAGDDAGTLWTVHEVAAGAATQPAVYICHSREDSELAERLAADLPRAGIRVVQPFYAAGLETMTSAGMAEATAVVVIASRALFASTYARQELDEALRSRKLIITLNQGVNRFDLASELPELASFVSFKDTDWADEKRYARFIERLAEALREG